MTQDHAPTHTAFAKKYVSKKLYIWLEIGKGREDKKTGQFHGMLDRTPIGGFNGYVCYVPIGSKPPEPEPERPEVGSADEGEEIS
jgi:hypothetical protein